MPRAAGSAGSYSFYLKDYTGHYRQDVSIELPSVTTILNRVLAKPQLVSWAYRMTRDNISGMVQVMRNEEELIDVISDPDMLEEYLKANKLRPDDVRDEAGTRGTAAHAFLESLATLALNQDHGAADEVAATVRDDPYLEAVAKWWTDAKPYVIQSETILPCPSLGYCGTVDLVHKRPKSYGITVTDLKTRKAGQGIYDSDELQTIAYRIAYELLTGTKVPRTTVLLAYDDGTYGEIETTLPDEAWYHCLELDKILQKRGTV